MVNKDYCMSSYLTFRYVEDPNILFKNGMERTLFKPVPKNEIKYVENANEIYSFLEELIKEKQKNTKLGILLSGGMDSACLAHFLNPGTDAYTFRFLGGLFNQEELKRAELFAQTNKLKLHYVDINFEVVKRNLPLLMEQKGAPVHSIEPQIMEAALQAKKDGVEQIIAGDGADSIFGGLDKILSKDWDYEDFKSFFTYLNPVKVLNNPIDMDCVFLRYKLPENKIDYIRFMHEVFAAESSGSYYNSILVANMKFKEIFAPYSLLCMKNPFDLKRIRNGESKYLIRELFKMCYPEFPIPEKLPMPRPVDYYFKDWQGPTRPEFRNDIDMSKLTGNQKWQLYCLEEFLNMIEDE